MNCKSISIFILLLPLLCSVCYAQKRIPNIPYVENGHERQVLDIYTPNNSIDGKLPVLFWIHGGGWKVGDKSGVALKPKALTDRGFVFVSTNYRFVPEVEIDTLIRDVALSISWVHKHIKEYDGDPSRIFVGGHSAGAQLAALICIDDRYLQEVGVGFEVLKGCIPVDGGAYDIRKNIMSAEFRQTLYGDQLSVSGIRKVFGNDPEKHIDLSAVTHIAKNKGIPPFLLLYFSGNPKTRAQALYLETVLRDADVRAKAFGKSDTNHMQLNDDLGKPDDPATQEFFTFLDELVSEN